MILKKVKEVLKFKHRSNETKIRARACVRHLFFDGAKRHRHSLHGQVSGSADCIRVEIRLVFNDFAFSDEPDLLNGSQTRT